MKYFSLIVLSLAFFYSCNAQQSGTSTSQPTATTAPSTQGMGKKMMAPEAITEFVDDPYVAALAEALFLPMDTQIEVVKIRKMELAQKSAMEKAGTWVGPENFEHRKEYNSKFKKMYLNLLGLSLIHI